MTQSKNVNQPKSHISATEEDWVNQALVQEIMSQLLEEHREVLELRIIRGYTRKETAECMGRSEDSIRGLQYRALKAFRDLLQAREENGG
jgi:RNA polymerase sigma-70 factor (ECF subfamily)